MTRKPSAHPACLSGPDRTAGFTLVELMISIAMVLILLIGVNQIFKMSADTVGSGMATSEGMRNLRAVRTALTNDLTQMTSPSAAPFIIIHNQLVPNYLNKQDQAANPTLTLTADELLVPDRHAHRMDILQFFVSGGDYRRQTGTMAGPTAFQGDVTSEDAWVWFGHLRLPNNGTAADVTQTANYLMPGAGTAATNPNNFYANQWILGRERVLLVDKNASSTILDSATPAHRQWFSDATPVIVPPPVPPNLRTMQPLAWNSPVNTFTGPAGRVSVGSSAISLQSSFTDVAGASLGQYKTTSASAFAGSPANAARQMVYQGTTPTLPGSVYRFAGKSWLDKATRYAGGSAVPGIASQSQLLSFETALEAPIFLRGCSQFIVEYAGDYMQQNPASGDWVANGANPTAPELDWNPVYSGSTVVGRSVRWYGLNRAANIPANVTTAGGVVPDVLPLYWYLTPANHTIKTANRNSPVRVSKTPAPGNTASFERNDLLGTTAPAANNFTYDCAWGPTDLSPPIPVNSTPNTVVSKAPWMIRITIRVDDPNGRLPEGQTMEFIYELPHAK